MSPNPPFISKIIETAGFISEIASTALDICHSGFCAHRRMVTALVKVFNDSRTKPDWISGHRTTLLTLVDYLGD